jgi:hypothetical protein
MGNDTENPLYHAQFGRYFLRPCNVETVENLPIKKEQRVVLYDEFLELVSR